MQIAQTAYKFLSFTIESSLSNLQMTKSIDPLQSDNSSLPPLSNLKGDSEKAVIETPYYGEFPEGGLAGWSTVFGA